MSRYPKSCHFIDTCVLLEILLSKKKEEVRYCDRYVKRVGEIFAGVVSLHSLGEFVKVTLEDSPEPSYLFSFLAQFVEKRGIAITSLSENGLRIVREIKDADSRIELLDAFHLACATEEKCDCFVTIDTNLVHNQVLEKLLSLKIRHPKEFF